MMTIDTSRYCNARRPCRFSTGHGAARSHTQRRPLGVTRLPINAPPFGRYDPFSHRIVVGQDPPSTCRNSHTTPAALKSP
jgi:hypothetical protein